jgi:predicted nucleic acid-binding Zn ribbon protein
MEQSSRYRYPSVVDVAEALAGARHWLPWELEAPVRHSIRVLLILQGMNWRRADWIGHSLVARARIELGVRQPAGWDSDTELWEWLPDFDNPCPICGRAFCRRWVNQLFCSTACSRRNAEIEEFAHARVGVIGPPHCRFCWQIFEADTGHEVYCSSRCYERANRLSARERADADFAQRVRSARLNAGWNQAELARRLGIAHSYLGHVEACIAVMSEELRAQALELLGPYEKAPARYCLLCGECIGSDRNPKAKFCSRKCHIRWSNQMQRQWSPEKRAARNARHRARYAAKKTNGHDEAHGHRPPADAGPALAGPAGGPGAPQARAGDGEARAP